MFEFEGTVDELDTSSTVAELLRGVPETASVTGDRADVPAHVVEADDAAATQSDEEAEERPAPVSLDDSVPGIAEEGQETVRRAIDRNPNGELFLDFLRETTAWPSVRAHGIKRKGALPGDPLDYHRYLRLRKQGSAFGGFAYVYAADGVCNFRLNYATDAELVEVAPDAWRLKTGHREYRVSIHITDAATLRQAIDLARLAYDKT